MLREGCSLFLFGHVLVLGSGEVLKRLWLLETLHVSPRLSSAIALFLVTTEPSHSSVTRLMWFVLPESVSPSTIGQFFLIPSSC